MVGPTQYKIKVLSLSNSQMGTQSFLFFSNVCDNDHMVPDRLVVAQRDNNQCMCSE